MKPTFRFWSALCIAIAYPTIFYAQQSNQNLIPNVLPPTPDVASLGRFGKYAVSHFTGVPQISVPIYEVKVGDISLPISIDYHAAGIKLTDRPSSVGLGWALSTGGGSISRKAMGRPDELSDGYIIAPTLQAPGGSINPSTQAGLDYLKLISWNSKDVEPDISVFRAHQRPANSSLIRTRITRSSRSRTSR
jgi:hypothetical protein